MGDESDPWKQVNVRVRQSTKADWEDFAESEYGGMSDLVRTAVRREIAGDHDRQSGDSASSEVVTEVAEAIDRLENAVSDMDRRLDTVRETVDSEGPQYSFMAAVRETVPRDEHLTAGQIAARLDARESDVRDALAELDGSEVVSPDRDQWTRLGGE
jgi:hypothetical protein